MIILLFQSFSIVAKGDNFPAAGGGAGAGGGGGGGEGGGGAGLDAAGGLADILSKTA